MRVRLIEILPYASGEILEGNWWTPDPVQIWTLSADDLTVLIPPETALQLLGATVFGLAAGNDSLGSHSIFQSATGGASSRNCLGNIAKLKLTDRIQPLPRS